MSLSEIERRFLDAQGHGRLATVAPSGAPQVKPVGFHYNDELGTIDIYGFAMETSAKYRNIQTNPEVAFVVDDVIGEGSAGVRFLEVRGPAEAATGLVSDDEHLSSSFIRIRPRRLVGWNVDPDRPGLYTRAVPAA